MGSNVVYSCEYVIITRQERDFYIQSLKKGMAVEDINKVIKDHPEISITSFMAIKNALIFAPRAPEKFGELKERVIVEVTSDQLKAFVTIFASEEEIKGSGQAEIIKEVLRKLNDAGIVFGVKRDVILNGLTGGTRILIAEGVLPQNGKDSEIRMYEMKEIKPEIKEDGKVDHYELSLINKVKEGEWLGERLDATPGIPGKSVKGNIILPMPGKTYPLFYDRNSVREVYENGVTTLYAIREGAVFFEGEKIGVSNHLEITNNVDFKTGNIDFEGFITVKGSIEDNFSVSADKDVEILGDYGVGSVKEIVSRNGSVYIKGGIAGKNKAVVKSKKDIYTKFIADAEIICEGSVHVGFYCLNSNITAKEVILDSPKGQIMGGNIQAEIKVVSSIIGTPSEKRTCISVKGFSREVLKRQLEKVVNGLEAVKNDLIKLKQEMSIYTHTQGLNPSQKMAFERLKDNYFETRNHIRRLEDERKALTGYLRTHGEGEVAIMKKVYPNTMLEIKNITKEINKVILSTSFYYKDGEINEL